MASSWASIAKAVPKAPAEATEAVTSTEGLRLLVVDANAIISGLHLEGIADRAITIQEVFDEIRDKKSRQFLATLPYQLQISEPTEESIKQVTRFARATGDISALSSNDIKLLALAHTLEVAAHGAGHLHPHPSQPRMHSKAITTAQAMPGWGSVPNPEDWRVVDEANEQDEEAAAAASSSRIATRVQQLSLDPSQPNSFLAAEPDEGPAAGSSSRQPQLRQAAAAAEGHAAAPPQQQQQQQHAPTAAAGAGVADGSTAAGDAAGGGGGDDGGDDDGGDDDGWEVAAKSSMAARRRRRKEHRRQERQRAFEQEWEDHAELVQQQQQQQHADEPCPAQQELQQANGHLVEQPHEQQKQSAQEAAAAAAAAAEAEDASEDGDTAEEEEEQGEEDEGGQEESDAEFLAGDHQVFTTEDLQQQGEGEGGQGSAAAAAAAAGGTGVSSGSSSSAWPGSSLLAPGMPGWQSSVASVTADFAMQNVLLQLGLRLLTRDGRRIARLSRYALRCSACFTVTREAGRLFCPKCGNLTLDRVEVVVGPDGAEYFGVKKRHVLRGTKYSLPKPKGGRNSRDPVLREDIFLLKVKALGRRAGKSNKSNKAEQGEVDAFAPEFGQDTWHSGVASQRELAQHRGLAAVLQPSWKNNPNERKLTRSNRRG